MSQSEFQQFLATHKPKVDRRLAVLMKQETQAALKENQPYSDLLKQLSILINRGGKRLRPLLLLLAYQGYGGTKSSAALQAAVSQELLHAFLLIHDDIIDRDSERWGGRNILGVYFERYSKTMTPRDSLHFAEAQAMLAGDSCFALANKTLLGSGFAPDKLVQALSLQQGIAGQVIAGEVAEAQYTNTKVWPTEAQVIEIYRQKTASYSFALPLQLGALLAGASDTEQTKIALLAEDLGVAFQLQDDLLGTFGNESITGKSNVSDLREGRRTLLAIKALEMASPSNRLLIKAALGKADTSVSSINAAKAAMASSGAREYLSDLTKMYSTQAVNQLADSTMKPSSQAMLQQLIKQLMHRES